MSEPSVLELKMIKQFIDADFPKWEPEYLFCVGRKWRLDFAWPLLKIACEVEGGTWSGGRHTTGTGFHNDCEKYNQAELYGWHIFRFTSKMVKDGTALIVMNQALFNCPDRFDERPYVKKEEK